MTQREQHLIKEQDAKRKKEEIFMDLKVCLKCPYSDEEGMCESRGAVWKKGEWHPTNECIQK